MARRPPAAATPDPAPTGTPGISLEPITAAKRAALCRTVRDGVPIVYFASIGVASAYRVHDTARCEASPHRCLPGEAPTVECTCGFYALADRDALKRRFGPLGEGQVDLDVELAGRVVEHEQGWRAEHQDVTRIWLKRSCERCGRTGTPEHLAVLSDRGPHQLLGPVCARCARKPKLEVHPVAELAATAGVPIEVEPRGSARPNWRSLPTAVGALAVTLMLLAGLLLFAGAPSWAGYREPTVGATARRVADQLEALATQDDAPAGRATVVRGAWAGATVPYASTLWAATPATGDQSAGWTLVGPATPIGPTGLPSHLDRLAVVDRAGHTACLALDAPTPGVVRTVPARRCAGAAGAADRIARTLGR